MRKILIVLLVIIVVFAGYVYFSGNQKVNTLETEMSTVSTASNTVQENISSNSNAVVDSFTGVKQMNTQKSTFSWTAKKAVIKSWIDTGTVTAQSGNVMFKNGVVTGGEILIDMSSIIAKTTGSGGGQEKLTNHVKSADFFDVAKYPTAKVVVKEIVNGKAKGDLTIKDVTKQVEFPIQTSIENGTATLVGTISIDRSLYGVKFGSTSFFENLGDKAIDNIFTIDFTLILQ
jgi:polyisoprenoid-binding protein YceI